MGSPWLTSSRSRSCLHACGATINEMNCVRKHLSHIKGGRLAQAFRAQSCPFQPHSFPTSSATRSTSSPRARPPPTRPRLPTPLLFSIATACDRRLRSGPRPSPAGAKQAECPETLKSLPDPTSTTSSLATTPGRWSPRSVVPRVSAIASLTSARSSKAKRGTSASVLAGIVRSIRPNNTPLQPPVCLLSGGETTVTLGKTHGRGGRNQELVLATAVKLGADGLRNVVVFSAAAPTARTAPPTPRGPSRTPAPWSGPPTMDCHLLTISVATTRTVFSMRPAICSRPG